MDVLPNAVHAFGGPDAINDFLGGAAAGPNMFETAGAQDIDSVTANSHNVDGSSPSMHPLSLEVVVSLVSLMPVPSYSLRLLLTCTAGVSTLS